MRSLRNVECAMLFSDSKQNCHISNSHAKIQNPNCQGLKIRGEGEILSFPLIERRTSSRFIESRDLKAALSEV